MRVSFWSSNRTGGAFLLALLCLCGTFASGAISLQISPNSTVRSANAFEADYSSTHLYVDEINGDSIPITIFFDPGTLGVDEADVFTNLNNRDKANLDANGDGIPDGILPPNGNFILAGDTTNYFAAYRMNLVSGGYQITLLASKTGAYRLTARYHLSGDGPNTWHYYGDFPDGGGSYNFRDAAITVSPTKARSMVMYELNVTNVDAEAPGSETDYTKRSTFVDLWGGPGATTTRPWNLNYAKGMGVNWLWLQPVHPIGIDGRQPDPNNGNQPYAVGSPYAVKNFFAINPIMAKSYVPGQTSEAAGRTAALAEFQGFVQAADSSGVNVMLDVPFNHTAFDCELGDIGQQLFGNGGTNATTEIRNVEARFYSRWTGGSLSQTDSNNLGFFDYGERAFNAGSIALAADRFDFGKFVDVHDIYFGRYAALVNLDNAQNQSNYLSEGDWFDSSIGNEGSDGSGNGHFDAVTQNVWKYFGQYIPYWLGKTGHVDGQGNLVGNSTNPNPVARRAEDDRGLDGIRADFAQGLPPQCWEYLINVARSYKWDFVFLAESLDGGHVTYRSGRHFDVLNENIIFDLYGAQHTSDFRSVYDNRRNAYGQAMVLLDTESHDEAGYSDPFQAFIRYAVNSTVDGVPDVFFGQEIGISGAVTPPSSNPGGSPFGFSLYQVNFGKPIPQFMTYNSLAPAWNALGPNAFGQAELYPLYAAVGTARAASAALQSSNRYYLNAMDNSTPASLFGVAKYAQANAAPNLGDVVFAFVNLDRANGQVATFNVNVSQNGSNLFGIDPNRTYNVRNIAADLHYDSTRANAWLWGANGRTGSDVLTNGVFVALNPVPGSNAGWQSAPYEAQYLKLYDVTPPPAPGVPSAGAAFALGNQATFAWSAASDSQGGISGYQVIVSTAANGGGTVLFNSVVSGTSTTVTGSYGQKLYASVRSVNNAGVVSTTASNSTTGTLLLDPAADQDGDGMSNAAEVAAGTNPLDPADVFKVIAVTRITANAVQITWNSVPGMKYQVETSTDLTSGAAGYTPLGSVITAVSPSTSFTDNAPGAGPRFYHVKVVP